MSSTRLTEVESKINEVRHRLANLSLSFQLDEDTARPCEVHAVKDDNQNSPVLVERDLNRSVTAKSAMPASTGDMNRLVELARREAAQRDGSHQTPQPNGCKERRRTTHFSTENLQIGLQGHTYYDPTPAAPTTQYHVSAWAPTASFQQQPARSAGRAPLYSSHVPTSTLSCAGHRSNAPAAAASTPRPNSGLVGGFDPLQAVQARLREKLRKSAASRSPLSSPGSTEQSPSPKPQELWQTGHSGALTCAPDDASNEVLPSTTQTGLKKTKGEQQEQQNVEASTPKIKGATDVIRNAKQRFASPGSPGVASLSQSFLDGKGHCQNRVASKPLPKDVYSRSSSAFRSESFKNPSSQKKSVQTPRRPSSVASRQRSPCQVAQPALPRKSTPQRTVLDVLTGAEVFALMRLRGIIVSRGETGECTLPETRCHSIYLSPDEHKQLLDLRANLRLRHFSVKKKGDKSQPIAPRSLSRKSSSKPLPVRRSSSALHDAPKW
ncbi:hypothetical protein C4B63_17g261 [Trypanosoma cruzi]|uniref:Uncharacterized protein n=1 Tax=Trypanosoma cruzi TaxID=5693 RepID=A0A2V2VL07_TRYCR|nr:hypothetical protein C4B63_17g261 [Trypanosoma cruzi]